MLRAILLLSFIALIFAGIFQYTNKAINDIEENIATNVHTALYDNGFFNKKDTNIFITVDGRNVTLQGNTINTDTRSNIEKTARSVFGVKSLTSNISIASPKKITKKISKKGLSLSSALSSEKTDKEEITTTKNPLVLNIIKCDPEVCAKAKKQQNKEKVK